jgi:hypothetical protein
MPKKVGRPAAKKTTAKKAKPVRKKIASKSAKVQMSSVTNKKSDGEFKTIKLSSAWRLSKLSAETLWTNRRLFLGITVVYGLLNLILVQGLASSIDVANLKHALDNVFSGHASSITSSVTIFADLVGSAGNGSSQTAGAYQLFLALMSSLAVIWALRQIFTGHRLRVRDAYYKGMYPLVPFILVLIVIGLQLLPLIIGSALYSLVISNGIAIHLIEKTIFALIFALLAAASLYMISSSLFALYIVTLPDMAPLKALRSARQLVSKRRLKILLKILFLPVGLLIVAAIIMLPILVWLTPLAQWIFFLLTMLALVAAHAYMYTLYRELLNE